MKLKRYSFILECYKLLTLSGRKKYFLLLIASIAVTILDLVGVSLVGLLTVISLSAIQRQTISSHLNLFLDIFQLSSYSVPNQVAFLGIIAASVLVFRTLMSMYLNKKMIFFLANQCTEVSKMIYNGIFHKSILFLNKKSQQQLIFLLSNGVEAIMVKILPAVSTILVDSFLFLILTILLFIVQPIIAIITLLFIAITILINIYFVHSKSIKLGSESAELEIEINSKIKETLEIFDIIVLKNRIEYFVEKFVQKKILQANVVSQIYLLPNMIRYTFEITIVFAMILIGAFQFIFFDSTKAAMSITIFLAASARIAPALLRIQQAFVQIQSNSMLASQTLKLIYEATSQDFLSVIKSGVGKDPLEFTAKVSITDLSFEYEESSTNLLISGLTFEVNEGEMVAIIGESGAGKSTLINLILGFLPNKKMGKIMINDMNPREIFSEFPGAVSYVPQKSNLIAGSVRENICLGYDPATFSEDEFWRVLDLVDLRSVVKSFENGLDQNIFEGGSNLSGGQKQKLAIARALFTYPKLLILDEPTSALDGGADDNILKNLKSLEPKLTLLIITHKYSTMILADKILFMRKNGTAKLGELSSIESTENDYFSKVKYSKNPS